jgi:hypothetical protein
MTTNSGTSTLTGGDGATVTNVMTANGGTSTLVGGAGQNTFNLNGAGTYTVMDGAGSNVVNANGGTYAVVGGVGSNTMNVFAGTGTLLCGAGPNNFNLLGPSTTNLIGGSGPNALTVQCAAGGDAVHLAQNGSTITVSGTIGGSAVSATATNMNSVLVKGSQAGNNVLDARGMTTMGVSLLGVGPSNTLYGGAGADTLNGGPGGNDSLYAGNNSDKLYVSGSNSTYVGTESNQLIYTAPANANVVVYGDGLLVTPSGEYGSGAMLQASGQVYSPSPYQVWTATNGFASGTTWVPFASVSRMGNVVVQPASGSANARLATSADFRGSTTYENEPWAYGASGFGPPWGTVTTGTDYDAPYTYGAWGFPVWPTFSSLGYGNNNYLITVAPGQTVSFWVSCGGWQQVQVYTVSKSDTSRGLVGNFGGLNGGSGYCSWTNNTGQQWDMFVAFFYATPWGNFWMGSPSVSGTGVNWIQVNDYTSSVFMTFSATAYAPVKLWSTIGDTLWTTGSATAASVPNTPALSGNTAGPSVFPTIQAVTSADQLAAAVGRFVNQAGPTFAGSSVPVIQQVGNLISLAQQTAALQPSSDFVNGVTTFLNNVTAAGLAQSSFVQQQVLNLNTIAGNGQTGTTATQGLLWFLDHVYFGGLTAAPFAGTSVTALQVTANGTAWFTCANGVLGTAVLGQSAAAVSLNGTPVQIASVVIGGDGTAWFVTSGGQSAYCRQAQSAAVLDPVAQFVLSAPASATAGTTVSVTVTAQDAAGNVILDYPGTVQFSSSDQQAGLPASYTFTAADLGSHTFAVTLKTAGAQTITATAGSASGPATVQVTPAAAASFAVSGPGATTAGAGLSVTVTVKDAYGNTVIGYGGTVQLSSSDPQVGQFASYPFSAADQGSQTFAVTLKTAGTQTITATAGSVSGQASVQVAAAGVAGFAFSRPTVGAGAALTVTVMAKDAFGNTITGYTGPVQLGSSDPQANLPASCTFCAADQGCHTFSATFKTAGAQSITATAGSLSGQGTVQVVAGAAVGLSISAPSTATAGVSFPVAITARDVYGNVATGYSGRVWLYSSDGQNLVGTSYADLSGGAATVNLALDTANTLHLCTWQWQWWSPLAAGTSGNITVHAAAAAKLAFVGAPGSTNRGRSFTDTLQLEDQFGNYVNEAGVAVTLTQSGGSLSGTGTLMTNAAGQVVFNNLTENTDGSFWMYGTASGLSSASAETSVIY